MCFAFSRQKAKIFNEEVFESNLVQNIVFNLSHDSVRNKGRLLSPLTDISVAIQAGARIEMENEAGPYRNRSAMGIVGPLHGNKISLLSYAFSL